MTWMPAAVAGTPSPRDGDRAYLRWLVDRFGERAALGPAVCLAFLPFSLIGPVLLEPARIGIGVGESVAIGLVAQGGLTAVMLTGQRLVHRPGTPRSRPLATLLVIELAVVVRAFLLAWLTMSSGATTSLELGYRLATAVLANAGVLVVIALVMSTLAYHRLLAGALQARRLELDDLTTTMRDRLDLAQADLAAQVRATVEPLVLDIDAQLQRIAIDEATSGELSPAIRRLIDDELRPMSHRLAVEPAGQQVAVADREEIAGLPIPSHLPIGQVLRPLSTSVLVMAVLAPQGIRILGLAQGALFTVITGGTMLALLAGAKAALRSVSPRFAIAVVAGAAVDAVSLWLALRASNALGVPLGWRLELSAWLLGGMLGALAAAFVGATSQRAVTEAELRRSIDELQTAASVLRRRSFLTRRRLAYVLHGSVQSALHAASMRLAAAERPDAALIDSIRGDLGSALARLDVAESPYQLLVEVLDDIAELWDGTCSVRWTMDHRTIRLLAVSPDAAASAAEIVRECVTNAIRHGGATEVRVSIAPGDDRVVITTSDNGRGVDATAEVGLGTRMLDEMCLRWVREPGSPGTVVVAELATPVALAGADLAVPLRA